MSSLKVGGKKKKKVSPATDEGKNVFKKGDGQGKNLSLDELGDARSDLSESPMN